MQSNANPEERPQTQPDTDQLPELPEPPSPPAPQPTPAEVKAVRADALAIAELCQLAGYPERTAGFLAEGLNESQVRKVLLAARAESPEIHSTLPAEAVASNTNPQSAANPLISAIRKLTGKE